jgi:predicted membrane-bound mannosyltransferase
VVRALWPARPGMLGRSILLRFLAFYSVGLMLIYSAIPYKTPWCLLSFWHGMILLAGVGAVAMVRLGPQLWMRYIVAAILVVPAGQLAFQAWRINFKYVADARHNPYLYSMPGADFLRLVNRVEELAKVSPARGKMFIRVVSSDCWPLPWYLRGFERVEYWNTSSGRDPFAEVVIGKAADGDLEARLGGDFVGESFGLRRGVVMTVYVEKKLWEEFRKGRR